MMGRWFKKGFTLVEVNLAIFIMATGVLTMCGLYSMGYRENTQSVEDVDATAYADAVLAPLVTALSSTQLSWKDWVRIGDISGVTSEAEYAGIDGRWPAKGWRDYIETRQEEGRMVYRVRKNCTNVAKNDVYGKLRSVLGSSGVQLGTMQIPSEYKAALVVTRRGQVVQLAFRMSRRAQSLFAQPVFCAEVHFQGGFKQGDVQ